MRVLAIAPALSTVAVLSWPAHFDSTEVLMLIIGGAFLAGIAVGLGLALAIGWLLELADHYELPEARR